MDSDVTAKALLSNGQLRNRVTIIPLNKVCQHATCMLPSHILEASVAPKLLPEEEIIIHTSMSDDALKNRLRSVLLSQLLLLISLPPCATRPSVQKQMSSIK